MLGLLGMYLNWREGLERRFIVANFTLVIIGLGSAAFHGTLTHIGQQGDETPMVIGSVNWLWCLRFMDPAFEKRHPDLGWRCAWMWSGLVLLFGVLHYYCTAMQTRDASLG